MDMSSGKGEGTRPPSEGLEMSQGIQVEKIDAQKLEDIRGQLSSLEYSALDTSKNRNSRERRESIGGSKLLAEHISSRAQGTVLVARENDKIIGILTLNRHGKVGTIDDIWLKHLHNQKKVIAQLLYAAKEDLQKTGLKCDWAKIAAAEASEDLKRVHHLFDAHTHDFFKLVANDNDPSTVPKEAA